MEKVRYWHLSPSRGAHGPPGLDLSKVPPPRANGGEGYQPRHQRPTQLSGTRKQKCEERDFGKSYACTSNTECLMRLSQQWNKGQKPDMDCYIGEKYLDPSSTKITVNVQMKITRANTSLFEMEKIACPLGRSRFRTAFNCNLAIPAFMVLRSARKLSLLLGKSSVGFTSSRIRSYNTPTSRTPKTALVRPLDHTMW